MLFLDSADRRLIKEYNDVGILRGVTTNPTILYEQGIPPDSYAEWCEYVCGEIAPHPLSFELTANDTVENMIAEARDISEWHQNMVVKVPIHGPQNDPDKLYGNLYVISELEFVYDVRVNVTAMMSAQQCYLAALAGASYVSLFAGRVEDMGYDPVLEIQKFIIMRDRDGLESDLIVGSVRKVIDIMTWLVAGADFVTVPPQYIPRMQWNPRTGETVAQFLEHAASA